MGNSGAVASGPARGVYRARRPKDSALWRLFDAHYEEFEGVYEERFEETYGELRPSSAASWRATSRAGSWTSGSRGCAARTAATSTSSPDRQSTPPDYRR